MKRIARPFFLLLCVSALALPSSCKRLRGLFAEKGPPFNPCDPYYDYYENGKHFAHDTMIREDGTIDYRRIFKGLDPEYTRCDPLGKPPAGKAPPSGRAPTEPHP